MYKVRKYCTDDYGHQYSSSLVCTRPGRVLKLSFYQGPGAGRDFFLIKLASKPLRIISFLD